VKRIKNELIPVADDLFCFGGPFNLYLLVGDGELALLEGGLSVIYPPFVEALKNWGFDPSRITSAVILHAHSDHLMGLAVHRDRYPGVRIFGSSPAREILKRDDIWQSFREVEAATSRNLALEEGLPPVRGVSRLEVDEVLSDGTVLEFGRHRIQVIATPGHSPCSLSLLVDDRVLLVSDALGAWIGRSPEGPRPSFFWDPAEYIASARRLEALGAEVLCLGHNGFLRDGGEIAAFFRGHWRQLEMLLEEVSRIDSPKGYERLSRELARRWYVDFLRFFPWEAHLQAVRVLLRRALQYLGRDEVL